MPSSNECSPVYNVYKEITFIPRRHFEVYLESEHKNWKIKIRLILFFIESNSFFKKQFDILSEELSQCRAVPAYTAPGESDHPQTKIGVPGASAEVEHIPFF